MMKTKFMYLALALSLAALSACSEAFPTSELAYMKATENYVKADALTFNGKYSPYDFISLNDKIVATDSENDCLLIIDKESGSIETNGQTGNGGEDYLSPHGIWASGDFIYVMDSGNKRIKILDSRLKVQDEIRLSGIEFTDPFSFLNDISVDESDHIFFTVYSTEKRDAKLYYIEKDTNEPKVLLNNCTGVIASYHNKTYFTNTYEFGKDKDGEYASSGTHYIYEIENNEVISAYLLPEQYTPTAISIDSGGFYCSSIAYREISKIDLDKMQVMPMFSEPTYHNETADEAKHYGALMSDNGSFLLVENNKHEIYKLTEE